MKIRIILIISMLAISVIAEAQISNSDFSKAVNYVNCKYVESSLKKSTTQDIISKFESKCNCSSSPDFTTIKNAIPQTETRTIALSSEIDHVKENEFKPSLKSSDVIQILTETIFTDQTKYSKLFEFANKRRGDEAFLSLKNELKKDLLIFFPPHPIEAPSTSTKTSDNKTQDAKPSLEERLTELEQQMSQKKEEKNWFGGVTLQIDLLSIIIAVAITLLLMKIIYGRDAGSQRDVSERIKNYVKGKISDAEFSSHSSGAGSFELADMKNEIKKMQEEIRRLNFKIKNINNPSVPLEVIPPKYEHQSLPDIKQAKNSVESFFLSTPNADGSFNESSISSSYREGASIYKFTKIDNNKAKFQIDEREASVRLALQYPDKNIDPVCDAMNAFNPKARRISTTEPGEVELQGDKWIKTIKAKITYES